ncbi:MAG: EamA family transporter [Gammaproteobacteria bacterium]|nr:EamA family transporter [Gammaproteobacteria bacterium]
MRLIHIVMGVSVALIWGMGLVFAKAAIGHFPPILLMALRFLVTALTLVWWVPLPKGEYLSLFWVTLMSAALQYSMTYTGLKGLDASVTALLVQLEVPFLIIAGTVLLSERNHWPKWLGVLICFGGVALIVGEPKTQSQLYAVFLVIGGCACWAVGQVMVRKMLTLSGMAATAWVAVYASIQLFVMSWIFEDGQRAAIADAGWVVLGAVVYLGLVMTAVGYGFWFSLLRIYPVGMVAPFLLLMPLFSVLGSVWFLGETLSPGALIGGAVVIFGVGLITFDGYRRGLAARRAASTI